MYETSVEVSTFSVFGESIEGGHVNNLGLMPDRQNGIISGIVLLVGGLIGVASSNNSSHDRRR